MESRFAKSIGLIGGLMLLGGCALLDKYSGDSGRPAKNEPREERLVRVWLDGHECQWGEVWCEVPAKVSAGPDLKYELTDADAMGRVSMTIINIFHEVDGGWASNADYIVTAKNTNDPDAQMKPGKVYPLGKAPEELNVMDGAGNALKGIKLASGTKYLMNFVVSADRSETVGVVFTAR